MKQHKLIFFTGAGISAESGILTFQSQEGIKEKLERRFCLEHCEELKGLLKGLF